MPVRSSSTEAYCPVRLTRQRTASGFAHHVVPEDAGLAAVRAQQRGQHPHGGRLARAVGAEHAVDGAGGNLEIDAVHGAVLAEDLHQPFVSIAGPSCCRDVVVSRVIASHVPPSLVPSASRSSARSRAAYALAAREPPQLTANRPHEHGNSSVRLPTGDRSASREGLRDHGGMATHLITGAGSGIGAAVTRRLLDRGDELWLLARDAGRAKELAERFPGARTLVGDLGEPERLSWALSHQDAARRGWIRCSTSRASSNSAQVGELTPKVWDLTLAANLVAPAELTRLLLPQLRLARGHVLFVNSGAGLRANAAVGRVRREQARAQGARGRAARGGERATASASPPSIRAVRPPHAGEGAPPGGQGVRPGALDHRPRPSRRRC